MDASLNGLTLHVSDVERSRQFYERIPGAELLHHRPGQFALFQVGHSLLGLLRLKAPGFHVEIATADLDGMHRHLLAAGIEPQGEPRQRPWGERTMMVADPDGYLLEFEER
jgi:catechol 2,3-dioxygenase-like lactoylglutathione lyase family enzyme